jgi:serine/threonine protein kinase
MFVNIQSQFNSFNKSFSIDPLVDKKFEFAVFIHQLAIKSLITEDAGEDSTSSSEATYSTPSSYTYNTSSNTPSAYTYNTSSSRPSSYTYNRSFKTDTSPRTCRSPNSNERGDKTLPPVAVKAPGQGLIKNEAPIFDSKLDEAAAIELFEGGSVLLSLNHLWASATKQGYALHPSQLEKTYRYAVRQGAHLLNLTRAVNKALDVQFSNGERLFVTPAGKFYMKLSTVGSGAYKVALKVMLVGGKNLKKLQEKADTPKVISIDEPRVGKSEASSHEQENENKVNSFLYEQRKQGSELSHVCVSKPIAVIAAQIRSAFISTFAHGGNVNQMIGLISSIEQRKIALDMAKAVQQLHRLGIAHRDLKPDNFLIFTDAAGKLESVKVTDFGKATFLDEENSFKEQIQLPGAWVAPECGASSNPMEWKTGDIYQLGVTLYQIFAQISIKQLHFTNKAVSELLKAANQQAYDESQFAHLTEAQRLALYKSVIESKSNNPKHVGQYLKAHPQTWPGMMAIEPRLRELIFKMLNPDPSRRVKIEEVIHWLQEIG